MATELIDVANEKQTSEKADAKPTGACLFQDPNGGPPFCVNGLDKDTCESQGGIYKGDNTQC